MKYQVYAHCKLANTSQINQLVKHLQCHVGNATESAVGSVACSAWLVVIADIFISLKITILTTNTSLDLCSHFSKLTGLTHIPVTMSLRTISFRELRVSSYLDIVDSQLCIISAVAYRIHIAELNIHDVQIAVQ